ncbi:MAG: extracellular solute-binding protein [Chloroflexi bacterium]|nr:extracellular solute-binding protein [Chloroflexota bacterium]
MRTRQFAPLALRLSAVLAVVALGVPAAQARTQAAAPVSLTFQAWDPTTVTSQFLAPCEKKYPNISVKSEPVAGNYVTKLQVEFAARTVPDFFYGDEIETQRWGTSGQLLNQLPYLKAMGVNPAKDFLRQGEYWAKGTTRSRVFYGGAVATEDIYLLYNKDSFAQAHVAPPPSDVAHAWTWAQFLATARKLTVDLHGHHPGEAGFDPNHIARYGVTVDPTFWPVMLPLIFSNGGRVFDTANKHFVMDQPSAADAVQAVVDLSTKEHVAPTPAQITASGGIAGGLSLSKGRVAMRIDGNWNVYFEQFPKKTYPLGIGVLPKFKVYRTVTTGAPLVAYAKTAHPKEAVQMIECIHKNSTALWKSGLWMPTAVSQLFGSRATWYKTPVYPSNYRSVAIDTLKYAQDTPAIHTPQFGPAWNNIIVPAIQKALSGSVSARAALTAVKQQVDATLAQP